MKEERRVNKVFLIVALLIVLGAPALIFRSSRSGKSIVENNQPSTTNSGEVTTSTTASSGLKTYRNEQFGFEFSYPQDVYITDEKTQNPITSPYFLLYFQFGGNILDENGFTVESTKEKDIEHLSIFLSKEDIKAADIKEQHYIILSGEKARVTTFKSMPDADPDNHTYVQVIHDGKLFSFMTNSGEHETGGLTETMLSTFKFLK